jgi:hypothetical protein
MTCAFCKKPLKKRQARFCSRGCFFKGLTKPTNRCRTCGDTVASWKKVCNRKCLYPSDRVRFSTSFLRTKSCWLWTRGKTSDGYGTFRVNGKPELAHRFSYRTHNGMIPSGILVCHTCDETRCVNPDHLFLGTQNDNMKDMAAKGRGRKSKECYEKRK